MNPKALFLLAFALLIAPVAARDMAAEARLVASYTEAYPGEELVFPAGPGEFIGLLRRSTVGFTRGSLLILPPLGASPDAPGAIRSLRQGLPESGWETLVIQLPLAAPGEPTDSLDMRAETDRRVGAALSWLRARKPAALVLLGQGSGAGTAVSHLAGNPNAALNGLVLVNLPVHQRVPGEGLLGDLARLSLPTLDLQGDAAGTAVVDSHYLRRQAAAANPAYDLRRVAGADDDFRGMEHGMLAAVRGWLRRLVRPDDATFKWPGSKPAR